MKSRTVLYGIVLALLAVGVGSAWVAQYQLNSRHANNEEVASNNEGRADVVSEHVTLTVTEGVVKKWQLVVDTAVYNKHDGEAQLTGVTGEFYGASGEPIAHFQSPRGVYDETTKSMTLLDGATMRSVENKGALIQAPTLKWSTRSDRVTATGGVVATVADGLQSRGQRAEFALDMTDVAFTGGVTTQLGASS
ncbi:MAG: LPS export ABC transporter periplasmic protein LptC [Vampirovibrionales bacterium]|nr:LPS export ABC transporter periplasmic protein LptC [Vampirovibrionales bacterium]